MSQHSIVQSATIEIAGNLAAVSGLCADVIRDELSYADTVAHSDGTHGFHYKRIERKFYECDSSNRISIPAGLAPRVVGLCVQQGLSVEVIDHRKDPPRCARVDEQLHGELGTGEQELLDAARDSHLGQFVVQNQRELHRTIALICRLYDCANILIPVATYNAARRLHSALREPLAGRVSVTRGGDWSWTTNCVICTYRSAETAIPQSTDIVLFSDVTTMRSKMVAKAIANLNSPRRYAFVPGDLRLGRSHSLQLEAACGPVIHKSMPKGGFPANVNVLFCTTTPPVSPPKATNALAQKRADYWHQDTRNRLITEIARGFRTGDIELLWHHGMMLQSVQLRPQRVAVLVESAEHGRRVHELLPEWPFLAGQPGRSGTWPRLPDRCIVTLTNANSMPTFDTGVLINAIGGEWIPEIKGFPPESRHTGREVLLVDFADDANERLREATHRRIESYRQHDWPVIAPRRLTSTV